MTEVATRPRPSPPAPQRPPAAPRAAALPNLRRLLRHARPYRWLLARGIAAGIVGVVLLGSAGPILQRAIVDGGILGRDPALLWRLLAAYAAAGALRAFLNGVRRQSAGEASVYVEGDLRDLLYEHVQALDVGYHERVSVGQVMSRASSDLQAIRNLFMFIPLAVAIFLQLFAAAAVMFWLDPPLAALSMLTLPALAAATRRFARRFDPVVWRLQQRLADLASVVEETVAGIRVVKAFGQEAGQVAKLEREAEGIFEEAMEQIRLRAWIGPLFNLLPQLGLVAVIWLGGYRAVAGHVSIGTLVAFNAYLMMLTWPIRMLAWVAISAQRAATASGRIFEVLDTKPGVADRPGAVDLVVARGDVSFEDVSFAYPGGRLVLEGVNLRVPGGTSLAIVGPTGCGKSTLVRMIPRFIEPTAGRVTIDGVGIEGVTLRSLRSAVGMVFEDTFLFSDTIAANIAFGRPDAPFDKIVAAAAAAQAHEFVTQLPDGYDTVVGEQGYTLSGGQRQRLAIARAILMDPKILILDDATSSVDARVEAAIRAGLARAMRGRTTLIVARRPATAALADRVAYMESGRVVAVGTHAELWETLPAYREALGAGGEEASPVARGEGAGFVAAGHEGTGPLAATPKASAKASAAPDHETAAPARDPQPQGPLARDPQPQGPLALDPQPQGRLAHDPDAAAPAPAQEEEAS